MVSLIGRILCRFGFHRLAIDLTEDRPALICLRCGESTRREITYAQAQGKLVRYLEPLQEDVP